ncbi:MAG: DUF2752 domain-containing protein [Lentimicrobiaceae bacterium]|jgi:hypothetical protein|nr:DUF2752 domain-containing protein [Lentimicrobiaceae bacterium]
MKTFGLNDLWRFFRQNLEAFIWLTALLLLFFMPPDSTQQTLCAWHHLGIERCPGCGLGHAISAAFHGQFLHSFQLHLLGIPAIAILLWRSFFLFYKYFQYQVKQKSYDKDL